MSLFNKLKKVVKKSLNSAIVLAMYLHISTQTVYFANDIYHSYNPTSIRTEFKNRFGFPIKGWNTEIEAKPKKIKELTDIIKKENKSSNFNITHIRVISDNYFKKNILDQMNDWVSSGFNGYYQSYSDTISINSDANKSVIHHEIKHAKAFEILEQFPHFFEQWETISSEESYLPFVKRIASRFRGLESFIDKKSNLENLVNGFINDYSRVHVHEDIAEICSMAEVNPEHLSSLSIYSKIKAKTMLAEEYNLIPRGFNDYSEIRLDFENCFSDSFQQICPENFNFFLEQSQNYLSTHSNTEYDARICYYRGIIYYYKSIHESNLLNKAIEEFQKAINRPNENVKLYVETFNWLSLCYDIKGDDKSSKFNKTMANIYSRTIDF